ncbi:MAG: tetratricopeptide repeat protein [Candidatus Omnitrophota bacterium]
MSTKKTYFILIFTLLVYCLSCVNNPLWANELSENKAHLFRQQGFQAQLNGDYAKALRLYKEAIKLAPNYAVSHNDLGIVYEKMNLLHEAEKAYKRAIELDPQYPCPYTNLALIYEKNKDFENAARLWSKRIELGDSSQAWTQKAKKHLERLGKIDKGSYKVYEETQTLELIAEVKELKQDIRDSSQLAAEAYFARGKEYYDRGEYVKALRQLHRAFNFDPHNKEVEQLLIEAQKRALLTP